jgi:hypothetical protein
MGGVADLETAKLYEKVWTSLHDSTRTALVESLNVDGSLDRPAVQPTYFPALLTQSLNTFKAEAVEDRERALGSVLRYLERVVTATDRPAGSVTVIERNVLHILKEVVQSPAFAADPTILERAAVPKGVVAKRD